MSEKPNKPEISRDAKFIKLWSGSNFDPDAKVSCAEAAGFSPVRARQQGGRIINRLLQNKKMQKELKKAGVDLPRLARKIDQLLEAKHPLAALRKNPETGVMEIPPDNFIQLQAAQLGAKLHDAFAPTRIDMDKTERREIHIDADVVHRLERFDRQREQMLKGETFDVVPVSDNQD